MTNEILNTSLIYFYYSYNNSFLAGSYNFEIKKENGKSILTYFGNDYRDYGEIEKEIDNHYLVDIDSIIKEYNAVDWDGFNESDSDVCDGDGFSLEFQYEDFDKLSAYGSNAYPKNYRLFIEKFQEITKPLLKAILEEKRLEFIKDLKLEKLDTVIIKIQQKGQSGSDSYEAQIFSNRKNNDNFIVKVHSDSGQFFPKGDYKVSKKIPTLFTGLNHIEKMVKKYNLKNWHNWDNYSDNYNNEESFHIDMYFSSGDLIANGTIPPENYTEFKDEFLSWLYKKVK